jgi:hypothetical protein
MTRILLAILIAAACGCGGAGSPETVVSSTRYDDVVALFRDWRAFQQPKLVDGVPDYSAAAMAAQRQGLVNYQRRLAAIDPSSWPVPQQADFHIVRAEMNGLEFDHRVLKPWANNPAFYVTVFTSESDQPAREGPFALGAVELWQFGFPLDLDSARRIAAGLRPIPALLEQAKTNLTGNGKDLWTFGAGSLREQSEALDRLAGRLMPADADLRREVDRAKTATDAFATWVEAQAASKTGPSGVGIAEYDWYLKHVLLLPYTWQDEATLMERELARAHAALAFEEQRNAGLPELSVVASADEHARRFGDAVTEYMTFLKGHDILTIHDDMEPALRARLGRFSTGPREFFGEVDYREPVAMRLHGYHWFDKAWMKREAHASPMRAVPLLYNIFDTRTEGLATGWEEMMMQAGLFDSRPRSRELIYILIAQRAARALGDLRMHANQVTLEQAAEFACANTPRGWLRLDGQLVRGEQHLYLQQPGYGTSYLIGKIQIEQLIADRRRQLGADFTMRRFMDELMAAGLIPVSLVRWQVTGELAPELRSVMAGRNMAGRN